MMTWYSLGIDRPEIHVSVPMRPFERFQGVVLAVLENNLSGGE